MPTFRSRQQENVVLNSFNFKSNMYPLVEIIKEHDRKRQETVQQSFQDIYSKLLGGINANRTFVDIPVYLKERASTKDEVLEFSRKVGSNIDNRTEALLSLGASSQRIIPVVSSYANRTAEVDSVKKQVDALRPTFKSIAYRILYNHFEEDWREVSVLATVDDFVILDLDTIAPYPSPTLKKIITVWSALTVCPKIVLRSAINSDVQNVNLQHKEVVFDADNGLLDQYKISFKANSFGDYVGIKKDDLTSGGTISPGFLFYNAVSNEFVGFRGKGGPKEDKFLADFETVIVPDVINSDAAREMRDSGLPYLSDQNTGWQTLLKINRGEESGKSQAKFKKIAMDHYLHCMRTKIDHGLLASS
jgi:hypothetical protein